MDFDWNAIRSFLRVAKTGTLSAAAADLGLSQPTVGRHISRLEESLGLRLFDHNQSGFELTPAGEQLLEAANNMALSAADVKRRAKAANPVKEAVRLTIEVRPWSLRLASRNIEQLVSHHQGSAHDRPINFTFLSQDEYLSISRLEADLAIRNRVPKQGNLISVKLGYLTYRIFGSERYCKNHPDVFDPASWQQQNWVGFSHTRPHSSSTKVIASILEGKSPRYISNQQECLIDLIADGSAIGILPAFIGHEEGFVEISKEIYHPQEAWLIYHPDLKAHPVKRRVKDRLQELFSESLGRYYDGASETNHQPC
ncbi:LysR family transcriptional regulator [uncultured Cohaesibacter sp.]|uniref:LysR family transcriptional regulator n=1 Tax=uncultured Cohaesibacter sp. TaxID=1002546 RepID=UPI0029C8D73F|nr:LysR family transcriptional regulator [uncultured Cohaesibacter sp.]